MKRLRLTGTPDPAVAPPAFGLLAGGDRTTESRLQDWTVTGDGAVTVLFEVEGDRAAADAVLADAPEVARYETTPIDDATYSLLVVFQPAAAPLVGEVFGAFVRAGMVVEKPVVYRDGSAHATLVGDPETLQAALDSLPAVVDVAVEEIGTYRGHAAERPDGRLSDRQREALEAALALGYYDTSRTATHAEVAERLGCAPSTVSEHLKKAESKLVRAVLDRGR
jgi:predicted DNA binding protein